MDREEKAGTKILRKVWPHRGECGHLRVYSFHGPDGQPLPRCTGKRHFTPSPHKLLSVQGRSCCNFTHSSRARHSPSTWGTEAGGLQVGGPSQSKLNLEIKVAVYTCPSARLSWRKLNSNNDSHHRLGSRHGRTVIPLGYQRLPSLQQNELT